MEDTPYATVSINIEQLDIMRNKIKSLELEAQALKKQLGEVRMDAAGDLAKLLAVGVVSGSRFLQWLIGRCEGEERIRGWPWKDLNNLVDALEVLPTADDHLRELATALRGRVRTMKALEMARAAGVQSKVAQIPMAALGTGEYEARIAQLVAEKEAAEKAATEAASPATEAVGLEVPGRE